MSGKPEFRLHRGSSVTVPIAPDLAEELDYVERHSGDESLVRIFTLTGHAMFFAGKMELQIAMAVAAVKYLNSRAESPENDPDFDAIFKKVRSECRNMGKLIREFKSLVEVDQAAEELINDARIRRNNLAHSYFMKRGSKHFSKEGRSEVVTEILEFREYFRDCDALFRDLIKRELSPRIGFSPEVLEAAARGVSIEDMRQFELESFDE